MGTLRAIVFAAALAGLAAGLFATLAQALGTTPMIRAAEVFEHGAAAHAQHAHEHGAHGGVGGEAWAPADGLERTLSSLLANLVTATGFALLLGAGFALRGRAVGWREGLFWGLAGFAAFALAPFLGLPPELPGAAMAPLGPRQVWWIATAAATAAGLGLLAFTRAPLAAVAGVALLVTPHIAGAPQPVGGTAAAVPEALAHRFAAVVIVTSLVFWALLGTLSALLFSRFDRPSGAR